jgi:hypothetical protein
MRFGIRPQAILLAGVPLTFLLCVLALASLIIKHTEQAGFVTDLVTQSEQMLDTVTQANRGVQQSRMGKKPIDFGALAAARAQLDAQERKLRDSARAYPQLAKRAANYSRDLDSGFALLIEYAKALRAGNAAEVQRIILSPEARRVNVAIENSQSSFTDAARVQTFGSPAERRRAIQALERELLFGALLGIGLTVVVTFLFGVQIVRRLRILGQNAQRLALGLPAVPVGGNDEISELDAIYRSMADHIATSARAHEQTRAELERERGVTSLLQKTLLPEISPIPGLSIHSGSRRATRWSIPTASSKHNVTISRACATWRKPSAPK